VPAASGTAAAAKPAIERIPIDETGTVPCGAYSLTHREQGFVVVHTQFDRHGDFRREVTSVSITHTITGPGGTLTSRDVGIDRLVVQEDGSAILAVVGLVSRFVVPGEGLVAIDVGIVRLRFDGPGDPEPELLFDAGRHDDLEAALCGLLAP
jgi:hypothetical protein